MSEDLDHRRPSLAQRFAVPPPALQVHAMSALRELAANNAGMTAEVEVVLPVGGAVIVLRHQRAVVDARQRFLRIHDDLVLRDSGRPILAQ